MSIVSIDLRQANGGGLFSLLDEASCLVVEESLACIGLSAREGASKRTMFSLALLDCFGSRLLLTVAVAVAVGKGCSVREGGHVKALAVGMGGGEPELGWKSHSGVRYGGRMRSKTRLQTRGGEVLLEMQVDGLGRKC